MLHSHARALLLSVLLASQPVAAQVQEGDVLVLDKVSDRVILVDPDNGSQTLLDTGGTISIPRGMDIDENGTLYVGHTTPSPDFFRDFLRIVPGPSGVRTTFGTFGALGFAEGLYILPDGSSAVIPNPGIFLGEVVERVDTFNGFRAVLAQGGYLSFPVGAVGDVDGTYLIVDSNLRPAVASIPGTNDSFNYDAGRGVFRIDPTIPVGEDLVGGGPNGDEPDGFPDNQSVVAQTTSNDSGYLVTPFRLLLASDGFIYVSDRGGSGEDPRIVRVDPSIPPTNDSNSDGIPDNQEIVSIGQLFDRPIGIAELEPGILLVSDADVGLIEVDLGGSSGSNQSLVSSGGLFDTPWEVHVVASLVPQVREPYYITDAGPIATEDAVWLVNPSNDTRVLVSEAGLFETAAGIGVDNDSGLSLVVVDPDASALVRVDPTGNPTTNQTLIWSNDSFAPVNLVVGAPGGDLATEYFLVDPSTTSVLRVFQNGTFEVLASSADPDNFLVDPVSITLDDKGFLMVLDAGDTGGGILGRIVRIGPTSGVQQCVGAISLINDASAFTRAANVESITPGAQTYVLVAPTDNPVIRLEIGDGPGIVPSFILASNAYDTPTGVVVDEDTNIVTPDAGDPGTLDDGVVRRLDVPDIIPTDDPIGPPGTFVDPFGIALVSSRPGFVVGNDSDTDGIADPEDNCVERANANQEDLDDNGFGDPCDVNADADGDGAVGIGDFGALSGEFGLTDCGGTDVCTADFDGDNAVGLGDLGILTIQFGNFEAGPAGEFPFRASALECVLP